MPEGGECHGREAEGADFDFRTSGEGDGDSASPMHFKGGVAATASAEARLKVLAVQKREQPEAMWKWPAYPGTPSRNFGQQQMAAMAEKRLGVAAAGASAGSGTGALKFPPSKWDDAEKWLMNTADSPAHAHAHLQARHLRSRGAGAAPGSEGDAASARSVDFAFPSPVSPPPRLPKHVPRRSAGGSARFLTTPVLVSPAVGRPVQEAEQSSVVAEDGGGSATGSEAFKDKFADSVVQGHGQQQQQQQRGRSLSEMPAEEPVSHRDMGTQMTPIPSQRASRCTTPGRANSPSRHNTPARRSASLGSICLDLIELQSCHLAKLEQRHISGDNPASIIASSAATLTLGHGSSTNWSSKEEEEAESSKRLRQIDLKEVRKTVIEARTFAWQQAEQAKYVAKFKREEMRIQAWENHKRAQAEADMKRIEVKLEKMRSHANEKAMNRLLSAHRRAEDMRALAQDQLREAAARTAVGAQQIRESGRVPQPPLSCFPCCAS